MYAAPRKKGRNYSSWAITIPHSQVHVSLITSLIIRVGNSPYENVFLIRNLQCFIRCADLTTFNQVFSTSSLRWPNSSRFPWSGSVQTYVHTYINVCTPISMGHKSRPDRVTLFHVSRLQPGPARHRAPGTTIPGSKVHVSLHVMFTALKIGPYMLLFLNLTRSIEVNLKHAQRISRNSAYTCDFFKNRTSK